MSLPAPEALADEVARLQAEEAASATRAERAADPTIAPAPPPRAPSSATAGAPTQANAAMAVLSALPPAAITPVLILALDVLVKRFAKMIGGDEAGARYALTADERAQLAEVWTPIVAFYLPQLNVHPLAVAVLSTGIVYGLKALPEGGLEAVLAGNGGAPSPQAVSTADLLQPDPAPTPRIDPVLAETERAIEELKRKREAAGGAAA